MIVKNTKSGLKNSVGQGTCMHRIQIILEFKLSKALAMHACVTPGIHHQSDQDWFPRPGSSVMLSTLRVPPLTQAAVSV